MHRVEHPPATKAAAKPQQPKPDAAKKPAAAPAPKRRDKPSSSFQAQKKPGRRESKSTSFSVTADQDFKKLHGTDQQVAAAAVKKMGGDDDYNAQLVRDLDRRGALDEALRGPHHKDLIDGVKRAVERGKLKPGELLAEAAKHPKSENHQDVAKAIVDVAKNKVRDATERYSDAREARQKADQRLSAELAKVGPALTEKERKAFIAEYKKEHRQVYRDEKKAATHLDAALDRWTSVLETAAKNGTPEDAGKQLKEVVKGRQALADSGKAGDSIRFMNRVMGDPKTLALYDQHVDDLGEHFADTFAAAVPNAAGAAIANHPNDPKKAADEVRGLLHGFQKAYGEALGTRSGQHAFAGVKHLRDDLRAGSRLFDALADGKPAGVKALAADADKLGKAGKAITGAGLALGLFQAGDQVAQGHYKDALITLAANSQDVADVMARGLGAYATAGKLGAKVGGTLARMAPGLGVLVAGVSAWADAHAAAKGHPGAIVSLVGDALSAVGSALEIIPVGGTVIGGILNAAGCALSALGGAIDTLLGFRHKGKSIGEESKDILEKIMDDAEARRIASAEHLDELSKRGMSQQDIRHLIDTLPRLVDDPVAVSALLDITQVLGVPPGKIDEFAMRLGQGRYHGHEELAIKEVEHYWQNVRLHGTDPFSFHDEQGQQLTGEALNRAMKKEQLKQIEAYVKGLFPAAYALHRG